MRAHRLGQCHWHLVVATIVCALQLACASASEQTLVGEGPRGAVYLERLSVRGATAKYSGPIGAFHATHPIALPPDLIVRILTALQLRPSQPASGDGVSPAPVSLFAQEDATFLAPLITTALSQATRDQRIRFLALSGGGRIEGVLFADGALLHITLTRYQHRDSDPPILLDKAELSFIHHSAQHQNNIPQSWMVAEPALPSISLNYQTMKNLPDPQTGSAGTQMDLPLKDPPATRDNAPPSRDDVEAMKNLIIRQAQEMQKLKEEVDALRRQRATSEAPAPRQPKKKKPAPQTRQP